MFDRKLFRAVAQISPHSASNRSTSLDAYRQRKAAGNSATVAMARLEELRPSLPPSFIQDHRLAFLAAAEHHDARALCLLLNQRAVSAGLHHVSALLFRRYAQSDAMLRLRFIWAHMNTNTSAKQTVHMNSTIFFRGMVEAFYREYAKETQGDCAGAFSVVDDAGVVAELFFRLGYEDRYNAVLETYNANLCRNDNQDLQMMQRPKRTHGRISNSTLIQAAG